MTNYTDRQRVDIARREYQNYSEGEPVKIDENQTAIGYVAPDGVIDNDNGQQSYIITDQQLSEEPTSSECHSVEHITLTYEGSTAPLSGADTLQAKRILGFN